MNKKGELALLVMGVDGHAAVPHPCESFLPLQMITHSGVIAGVLAVDMLALLMYNVSGMCVTGHLGAVFRRVYAVVRRSPELRLAYAAFACAGLCACHDLWHCNMLRARLVQCRMGVLLSWLWLSSQDCA